MLRRFSIFLVDFHVFDLFGHLNPIAPNPLEFPGILLDLIACMDLHLGVTFHCSQQTVWTFHFCHIHACIHTHKSTVPIMPLQYTVNTATDINNNNNLTWMDD
jgi:hypothetical protein